MSRMLSITLSLAIATTVNAQTQPSDLTLKNVTVTGSLDLDNGVPVRWKKPDGSGYINIFMLDKNGTLQLCQDPYYWDSDDKEHRDVRVIEVRNPKSRYPDFRLPVSRDEKVNGKPTGRAVNADSKLVLRSASFIETNDPAELNLVRTGTDDPKNINDEGPTGEGTVPGLIRWMSKKDQITTDVEIIARSWGLRKQHYGALIFQPVDARFPDFKWSPMLVMKRGVRVGGVRGMQSGVVGAALEVDSMDDRPVILRRPNATTTQPVTLALAGGEAGTAADDSNSLALIKAQRLSDSSPASRVEIQTNKGNRLETDWTLPVPGAQASLADDQSIPSGQEIALAFKKPGYDNDAMHDAAKEPTRLTCRTAGRYAVSAMVEFAANAKGSRQVLVRRNGSEIVGAMRVPAVADDGETTQITFTAPPMKLKAGDYVELVVRQTSGEALSVPAGAKFSMARVG